MLGTQSQKLELANPNPIGIDDINAEAIGQMMTQDTKAGNTAPKMETIESRFGAVTVDTSHSILFPVGLLGMPEMHNFVLTEFPNPKLRQFKLLQSLDDRELSFITLPVETRNSILEYDDIANACEDMEIGMDDLALLLIVSVHRGSANVQLSVNARAPIFIASKKQAAAQYVFTSNRYKVQHFISEAKHH